MEVWETAGETRPGETEEGLETRGKHGRERQWEGEGEVVGGRERQYLVVDVSDEGAPGEGDVLVPLGQPRRAPGRPQLLLRRDVCHWTGVGLADSLYDSCEVAMTGVKQVKQMWSMYGTSVTDVRQVWLAVPGEGAAKQHRSCNCSCKLQVNLESYHAVITTDP